MSNALKTKITGLELCYSEVLIYSIMQYQNIQQMF